MKLKDRLIDFRKNIRVNQKIIIKNFKLKKPDNICIFCSSKNNLTREHILPQWVYSKNAKKSFITTTNGINQTYNRSVLPCCQNCNNYILGYFELKIQFILKNTDLNSTYYTFEELELIILWLETMTYKLQSMEIIRTFKKDKKSDYIPFLADIPIALLQDLTLTPSKVFSNLRNSLHTLSIKNKKNKINSLLTFKSKNPDFHFMHSANNFIYLELPQYKVALFYFIKEEFQTHKDAYDKSMKILEKEMS